MKKNSRFKNLKKWLKIIIIFIIVCVVGLGIFIKLNPQLVANIADNYLRPLIGDKQVLVLENIFFNISDKANQVVYNFKQPEAPQFLDQKIIPDTSSTLDLTPIATDQSFEPIVGEGIWNNLSSEVSPNDEVMASTFVRPDTKRLYAIASIVQINTKLLGIGSVAGTKEPGGPLKNVGEGVVPQNVLDNGSLVAGFNGGFLYADGEYGMVVGDKTYVPLKTNMGTIAAYTDGSIKIFNYDGSNLGENVVFARQGGPLIIDNNEEIDPSSPSYKKVVGKVIYKNKILPGGIFTWRSGIGITKNGNLLYAVGNSLSPTSLSDALYMAGAVSAIQLDINPAHIFFHILNKTSSGDYISIPLNKEIPNLNHSLQYITGSQRDFFYLYKK